MGRQLLPNTQRGSIVSAWRRRYYYYLSRRQFCLPLEWSAADFRRRFLQMVIYGRPDWLGFDYLLHSYTDRVPWPT